jgi:predicted nucleotidyltransferase component of viral defense system
MFPGTLSDIAQNTLALLGKQDFLKIAYMTGGSSLALQLGHRRSIDFDFFTDKEFESSLIKEKLQSIGTYIEENETPKTMVGKFNNVKFSLFYYKYPLIAPTLPYNGINLVNIKDIVAMKLVAITDRGTKKDYIDLYFIANKKLSFEDMFDCYDKKYHNFEVNKLTLLKALQYFEDADDSDMPEMIEKIDWNEVKKFFQKETIRLSKKFLKI